MQKHLGKLIQLDGLRRFAAMSVVFHHYLPKNSWFHEWSIPLGSIGIQLFFVLSGFLITRGLLFERQAVERGTLGKWDALVIFYLKRALRIFPLYYFALFVLVVLGIGQAREHLPWLFFYASNIYTALTGEFIQFAGHFWSLAVEEQYYLLFPLLALFLVRRRLLVAVVIALLLIERQKAVGLNLGFQLPYVMLNYCGDALLLGGLLAILAVRPTVQHIFCKEVWYLGGYRSSLLLALQSHPCHTRNFSCIL